MEGRDGRYVSYPWPLEGPYSLDPSSLAPENYFHEAASSVQQVNLTMENQVSDQFHLSENHLRDSRFPAVNHRAQNPNLLDPFYQTNLPENQFLQGPSLQNHATAQNRQSNLYYHNVDPRWSIWSMHPGDLNTGPGYDNLFHGRSYDTSYRLGQSTAFLQCQFLGNNSFTPDSSSNMGSNSLASSPFENPVNIDLQIPRLERLRIDSDEVRGQRGVHTRANGVPFIVNDDLDYQGPFQFNLASFAKHQHGNIQNGGRNLAAATNRSLQRESQVSNKRSFGYSAAKPNRIKLDLGSRYSGRRANNGFQQANSNVLSSFWYNNNVGRTRQHSTNCTVEELRGRLSLVARDEHGCQFLQNKVDERNSNDIDMIFMEIKDELPELMVHPCANYLVKKLFGLLNEQQMTNFILSVVSSERSLFRICDDVQGTRVMQELLESSKLPWRQSLTPEQQTLIVSSLRSIAFKLCKSHNGHHVIRKCLETFSNEFTADLVEEIAQNCLKLAVDKSGCCVVPVCLVHAQEAHKGRLVADIVTNALFLSDHPYGNYVVQFLLLLNITEATEEIVEQLAGNYFTLSLSKYASNVVEKCLKESGEEQWNRIANEIIHHPDVLDLMLDPYGNYVIQSAWKTSKGRPIRRTIYHLVQMNFPFLQTHIYGSKVLTTVGL